MEAITTWLKLLLALFCTDIHIYIYYLFIFAFYYEYGFVVYFSIQLLAHFNLVINYITKILVSLVLNLTHSRHIKVMP